MPHTQHPIPALTSFLETYHSLNLSTITTLTSTPSPLEFMRYVAQNTPFVIRGGASDWSAVQKWNVGYLKGIMGEGKVQVAITPFG
jgi:jumonji domain-containing protein 7